MRFTERLKIATRAAVGLFSDRSATQAFGMLSGLYPTAAGPVIQRGSREILEAYSSMPWLRAVEQRISQSLAATQWTLWAPGGSAKKPKPQRTVQRAFADDRFKLMKAMVDTGELRQIEDHVLLDALTAANEYLIGSALMSTTQIHLDLLGEAFWIKERNGLGAPAGFWPVPPHWIRETPTPSNRNYRVEFASWQGDIPDTEILWFCHPDPANPYGRGSGLARALADELETDEYAARHTRMTFINRARPDFIVWPEETKTDPGVISEENARRLGERWRNEHQGFWRAAMPFFATRKIGIQELGQSFKDLDLVPLREYERDTIRQVYGLPPEMLGIIESGAARATIETGEYIYEKHVMEPRRELIRAYLQERLVPEYDERLVISYIPTIQQDKALALEASRVAPWALSVDEWRERMGAPAMDDPKAGEVHMVPTTITPVTDLSKPPAPKVVQGPPQNRPPAGQEPVGREISDRVALTYGAEEKAAVAACQEAGDTATAALLEKALADDLEDLPELSRAAGRKEPGIRRLLFDQFKDLQDQASAHGLQAAVSAGSGDAAVAAVPVLGWGADLRQPTSGWLGEAFLLGAKVGAEQAGITIKADISFTTINPEAVAWARQHAGKLITQMSDATIEGIRAMLAEALARGWTVLQAAKLIREAIGLTGKQALSLARFRDRLVAQGVTDEKALVRTIKYADALRKYRSLVIARTELIAASNAGQQRVWEYAMQAGLLPDTMRKVWLVTDDERLEAQCEALGEEEPIPVDAMFEGGIPYPPAHPQCRCSMGLVKGRDERAAVPTNNYTDTVKSAVDAGLAPLAEALGYAEVAQMLPDPLRSHLIGGGLDA